MLNQAASVGLATHLNEKPVNTPADSGSGTLYNMDSLPGLNTTDLSLASSFIPKAMFHSIVHHINQIDLSLYGMNKQFDSLNSALSPVDFTDFNRSASPIHSAASFAESIVVQHADFA